jgi:hypothetical protein
MTTAYWTPNQAAIAQVETYTFGTPPGAGVWVLATINGKTVTYVTVPGDTAVTVATAVTALLSAASGIAAELLEISFANPSSGVVTATAKVPGTPFANVPGTGAGLVLSTGNGWVGGVATAHTQANQSPNDVNDPQNWLRVTPPAPGVRQLPQNGDDEVVNNSNVDMWWNLDQLAVVQRNTFTRWQSFTATIGLPENNPSGYVEWRATYYKLSGPQGSVPAGGLQMVLGQGATTGTGPTRERYNVQSQLATLTILATGQPQDAYGVRFLGVHTGNTVTVLGGASLGVAMLNGEIAGMLSATVGSGSTLGIGAGVTWTTGSTLSVYGGKADLSSPPATLTLANGAAVTVSKDGLTWAAVTAQGGSAMTWLAGGTITTLAMTTGARLDKSQDARALTITNSTIDGDTCIINDPLGCVVMTNAATVKQSVAAGPFQFTGPRTVKVV